MLNSHLFLFGFLNDYLSLEMGFPPSKSVHPKLEYLKFGFRLGLCCHELFFGAGARGFIHFLLFHSYYYLYLFLFWFWWSP